jgi:hypothetical protein
LAFAEKDENQVIQCLLPILVREKVVDMDVVACFDRTTPVKTIFAKEFARQQMPSA